MSEQGRETEEITREAVEKATTDIRAARTPMSLRVLPSRPAAWAAAFIVLAQAASSRMPFTGLGAVGSTLIFVAAGFVIVWNARVRHDHAEWMRKKKAEKHEHRA